MQKLHTVQEFAEACRNLSSNDIYELFEFQISEDLRNKIYALADDKDAWEPVRAAFVILGEKYDVQSLKDY